MNTSSASPSRGAFSLLELVVVIAIIAIIAVFTAPQAAQILKGSTLSQGSTIVTDQIRLAREVAVTKNRKVEVRFYKYADPEMPGESKNDASTWQFRGVQVFEIMTIRKNNADAEVAVPVDKVQLLPSTVVVNLDSDSGASLSSILSSGTNDRGTAGSPQTPVQTPTPQHPTADPPLPRGVDFNYTYVPFRFQPDGSTDLAATGHVWTVTINNITDRMALQHKMPINYFTLQVDPVSGTTKAYRPTAG